MMDVPPIRSLVILRPLRFEVEGSRFLTSARNDEDDIADLAGVITFK
jgi:hypothetical protein